MSKTVFQICRDRANNSTNNFMQVTGTNKKTGINEIMYSCRTINRFRKAIRKIKKSHNNIVVHVVSLHGLDETRHRGF